MLSVQNKLSTSQNTAFTSRRDYSTETPEERKEAREYYQTRRELMDQQREFKELQSDEYKMPELAKKAIKGGAVVTSGLLGGMATGWGAKQSIKAFAKIAKSSPVKSIKNQIKATNKFIKESVDMVGKKFKASEAYLKPAKQMKKFSESKIGKPITKFFSAIGNGFKAVYKGIKKAINFIINKIKGVKPETYEKATVNFVGASGGVAAGVTTLKEQDEKGKV